MTSVAGTSNAGSDVTLRVLGVVGELLITAGVIVLLFLAWDLWWTDVTGDRAQAKIVAGLTWPDPPGKPGAGVPGVAQPQPGEPPVLAEPANGTTFATLQVPRWTGEQRRPISQGVSLRAVLNPKGIGHYPGTAMPGGVGNFATAGHRTTYGKPYAAIDKLRKGDALVVRTQETWYVYRVASTEIVRPDQVEVIAPVPGEPGAAPAERLMTMTSCHPRFSASHRYVVHAKLAYWAYVADGVPAELTKQ